MARYRQRLITAALAAVLAAAAAAGAGAVETDLARYLREHPGGIPTGPGTISYLGGALVVTLRQPASAQGSPDCPYGWFCFYDRPNWGYPRGKLSDCWYQNLATWYWQDRTESVHNNTGTSVTFYDGAYRAGSALFTAGSQAALSSVPANRANYVYRSC
ncbi:peptidase inhibitor family I36 protein [Dactylosporangium sp. AC04546]|uniref:peptidase inhibitor family I36 protein n=1 Tax=Dactylosporangium sp. AC04546 TaxID=2862460 RepID=UPI001EE11450|nr:peptidase inhibitor family I36 protein [Dactylosporangium sp. AC04546]WVK87452.1 peptidase inhibitor family I36 protein [Dactylosporangium sp. AC04546]